MRILLIITLSLTTQLSYAGDNWDFSANHKITCSSGGQQEMNMCLANEYKKEDQILNKLYSELLQKMKSKGTDTKALIEAQRSWLSFRDLECNFINPPHAGSLYSYTQSACLIDLTVKRNKDIAKYLSWGGCNGCLW